MFKNLLNYILNRQILIIITIGANNLKVNKFFLISEAFLSTKIEKLRAN